MKQQEIINKLQENHQSFVAYLATLDKEEFEYYPDEKWSAGQQLEHIFLSVKPLVQILMAPKFIIQLIFGKANRPSKTFEELVQKYKSKLGNGGRASGRFLPKKVCFEQKDQLSKVLLSAVKKLSTTINNYSEEELDTLILPHPLLGKVTLREMLYFTIYHVEHHQEIAVKNLKNKYL